MLVELRSGETYNGHLVACDDWMNIHLKEDGDRFWKMSECYVRGSIIKYLRIPDDVIDKVKEDLQLAKMRNRQHSNDSSGRGGFHRNKGQARGGSANRGGPRGGGTGIGRGGSATNRPGRGGHFRGNS